jgi:hypothetical protein
MNKTSAATGDAARCASTSSAQKLSASDFYLPLVHTLAYLTDYQPNTPVPMADAISHVQTLMGLDDQGAFEGGRSKLNRWVQWAFRNQRQGYCRKGEAPKTVQVGRGLWALTEEGVALAQSVKADFEPEDKPLTTAEWFEVQIRDKRLDHRCAALMKRNHKMEGIENLLSHVHLWFSIWSTQGYCDDKIAEGKPPTMSTLVKWLEHKWAHAEYRRAKDALNRETGKRTQTELRRRYEEGLDDFTAPESHEVDPSARKVAWTINDDDGDGKNWSHEVVDHEVDPIELLLHEDQKGLARDVISILRSKNPERYVRMFDHWIEGRSKEETAEIEGCSELRVSHLFQRVRDDLRKAPVMVEVALKVLALVGDEPWSTKDEINKEIRDAQAEVEETEDETDEETEDEKVDRKIRESTERALTLLRRRGLISEGKGSAFAPTEAGWSVIEMGTLV